MLFNQTILLIDLLGRYVRVVDHLAVRNVAQGAPLGGRSTLHKDKIMENWLPSLSTTVFVTAPYHWDFIFTFNLFSSINVVSRPGCG